MAWIQPETAGFSTWEAWAVDHLLRSCGESPPCDLHQQWEAHQASRPTTKPTRTSAEKAPLIESRLATNLERLHIAKSRLAAFYRNNATNADPASINLPIKRRAGTVTDAKVDRHKRLTRRINDLEGRIGRDRQRLAKLRQEGE